VTIVRLDAASEVVVLRNVGNRLLDLGGYAVDFGNGQRYTFSGYVLGPGDTLTLHTGQGDDAGTERYAGFFSPVIDSSDTVLVEDSTGRIVAARQAAGTTTTSG